MRFILSRASLFLLFILALNAPTLLAEENDEFQIRQSRKLYDNTTMSTRARGLGHSYAALSNGAMGTVENPAGLGAQTDHQLIFELGIDEIDDGGDNADVMTVNAGGSVNVNHIAPHYFPRQDMGNHTVGLIMHHEGINFDESDGKYGGLTGVTGAYGRSFMDGRLFGGASFSYAEGRLQDDDRTVDEDLSRWEFKAGIIARPLRELALGGTISYGRGDINDDRDISDPESGEVRHFELRLGGAYQISDSLLIVGDVAREDLDTEYDEQVQWAKHEIWTFSGGLESVVIPDTLTLRGGMYLTTDAYNQKGGNVTSQTDDYLGFTFGGSYFHENFELGYTFDGRLNGEIGNYFTLGFNW